MFKTAVAQLRFAASVGLGRPFAQWSLDHLIDAIKETKREFGAIDAEDGGSQLGGPVFDEETRREVHLRRFRTQAVRAARETGYYGRLFERLEIEPDQLRFEDIVLLPSTPKEALREDPGPSCVGLRARALALQPPAQPTNPQASTSQHTRCVRTSR